MNPGGPDDRRDSRPDRRERPDALSLLHAAVAAGVHRRRRSTVVVGVLALLVLLHAAADVGVGVLLLHQRDEAHKAAQARDAYSQVVGDVENTLADNNRILRRLAGEPAASASAVPPGLPRRSTTTTTTTTRPSPTRSSPPTSSGPSSTPSTTPPSSTPTSPPSSRPPPPPASPLPTVCVRVPPLTAC